LGNAIKIFTYLTILVFANFVLVDSLGEIPPPSPVETIYEEEKILKDDFFITKKSFFTIKEGWESRLNINVICGLKAKHTIETTRGISKTDEDRLVTNLGASFGWKNIAEVSAGISKITGTSVTFSEIETLSTEFELVGLPNQKVEWHIYQKYNHYNFSLYEKNFYDFQPKTSDYVDDVLLMKFEPLRKTFPYDCEGINFIGIPQQFKIEADLWLKGKKSEAQFIEQIRILADKKILNVEYPKTVLEDTPEIPDWFKGTITWWLDDRLEDIYIINSLEHLIKKEIIIL